MTRRSESCLAVPALMPFKSCFVPTFYCFLVIILRYRQCDDDQVIIVDFRKVVVNTGPTDFALETRAAKFMLDYDNAKGAEYGRPRNQSRGWRRSPEATWNR